MDNNNYNPNNQENYREQGQQQTNYQQTNYQQQFYQQPVYQQMPQHTPGHGAGIASMICGILSIVFCWCYGIVGLVLGIVAIAMYSKSKRMNNGFITGMAKAGMVCGIIGSILSGLMLVYFIIAIAAGVLTTSYYFY